VAGRVADKVAIVTGGAKGIGAADARRLAQEGARVVVSDVDPAGAEVARAIGGEFERHDVTDEAAWAALVERVVGRHGRLDILVNNAGIVLPGTILTQTADEWRRQLAVSADGTFFGCKHAIPAMAKNGGGAIVNMASIASKRGLATVVGYSAAKGAVEAVTRAIAAYCIGAKNGVRCNSIHPGSIDTPMVANFSRQLVAAGLAPAPTGPVGADPSLGRPGDIAELVLFLASDEARFVNGQEFVADAGVTTILAALPR
jgi:3(or 17)beta-hydroxysteroid dehydrogenase